MAHSKRWIIFAAVALAFGGCAPHLRFPPNTVSLIGRVHKPVVWTPDAIRADFSADIKPIQYTLKGEKHSAHAVPLLALVNAAVPAVDAKIKNDQLRFVIVVQGADGYVATFALAELSPTGGNREAWVALDMDDKPLPDRNAPANLIVPGDQKPERWVHAVQSVRLIDIGSAK